LPEPIRKILSDALVEAIKDPQFRERMHKIGVEPVGRGSAEAEVFFERELVRWKRVIDTAKLKLER
jgi:tripartite-type tricarboxylate transporter receptor subunit TctC